VTAAYAKGSYNGPTDSVQHDLSANDPVQECDTDPFTLNFGREAIFAKAVAD
jgi:hypothetical protein